MIHIDIPGRKALDIEHVVMDYNGTLACDGGLIKKTGPLFNQLSPHVRLHVITADTFGMVKEHLSPYDIHLNIIEKSNQDELKLRYIQNLGAQSCVAIGNGKNDRLMVRDACLGIVVIQQEGAAVETLLAADIVMKDVCEALECLMSPKRIAATLRL